MWWHATVSKLFLRMHTSSLWQEDEFQEVATKKNFWKLCVRVTIAAHLSLELTTSQALQDRWWQQKGWNWRGSFPRWLQGKISQGSFFLDFVVLQLLGANTGCSSHVFSGGLVSTQIFWKLIPLLLVLRLLLFAFAYMFYAQCFNSDSMECSNFLGVMFGNPLSHMNLHKNCQTCNKQGKQKNFTTSETMNIYL
jgi:hypothetical protein